MKRRMRPVVWMRAIITGCCGILYTCSISSLNGDGSGTRTGNPYSVIGRAVDSLSMPVAYAKVRLRPAAYLTPIPTGSGGAAVGVLSDKFTDDSGQFVLDSVAPGAYMIEVNNQKGSSVAAACVASGNNAYIDVGKKILVRSCVVRGGIPVEQLSGKTWFVQIYGLERIASVNNQTGVFVFPDVPAGNYTIQQTERSVEIAPVIIDSVNVGSGDTVVLPYVSWRFSRKLALNTTGSGAGVKGDVVNFPVLVRLTQGNFDFSQAKNSGADLRFTKSDGTPLPYEIERWDSAAAKAEIWVRVDTVHGNDSTHYITMYFGYQNAIGVANGAAVFDTANGFRAVIHLNKNCNDATDYMNSGTAYGTTDTAGVIGYSKKFHGRDSIKIAGLMGTPSSITLSAWTQLDTTDTGGAEVISVGDDALIRMDDVYHTPTDPSGTKGSFRYDSAYSNDYTVCSGQYLQKTGWHYLAFTIDAASRFQSLFIDGNQIITTYRDVSLYWHSSRNTYIGTHGFNWNAGPNNDHNRYRFKGAIDEVRVCRVARSPDWIKLCFMSQRKDDRLVTIK